MVNAPLTTTRPDGLPGLAPPGELGPVPRVVFIGGYGRSGSTLLDRLLGTADGVFSAGELRHVWREGYVENRLCGCGRPFLECPFWTRVTSRAFGSRPDVERILAVKERVDRYQRIPQIATGVASPRRRAELEWYGERLRDLYRAIAVESGARCIVDSSKDVSHGYVLARVRPAIDLRVVHLVRDSRAVAYSWQRTRFNPGSGEDMDRFSLPRTSAEWVAINALTAMQRRLGEERFARVRYEDLVADPATTLGRILRFAGEGDAEVPIDADGNVELEPSHTVAGNPMRFRSGAMQVTADLEWRREMPASGRGLVTALTLPMLCCTRTSTV